MSIQLHPDINGLDKEGLTYKMYKQLYRSFFDSQDQKSEEYPYGIVEGDETSIRLHNTAFSFANAVAGSLNDEGGGSNPGVSGDYLELSGGVLHGLLRANCGFEAGLDNQAILRVFHQDERYGLNISGDLVIGASALLMGGKRIFNYDSAAKTFYIQSTAIDFGKAVIQSSGSFLLGKDRENGVFVSSSSISIQGKEVFHTGNANLDLIDWKMRDGYVNRDLIVKGSASLDGSLIAKNGFELGSKGTLYIGVANEQIVFHTSLSLKPEHWIEFDGKKVLSLTDTKDVQIGGLGGDLLLGNDYVNKTRLLANLTDIHGEHVLVSRFGAGYFPDSLAVRHKFGNISLSTYRDDASDEGIVIHKRLRFGNEQGAYLSGSDEGLCFTSFIEYMNPNTSKREIVSFQTDLRYELSTSLFQPFDRVSGTLVFSTDADFVNFTKPVEAKKSIGIEKSATRLEDRSLFLSETGYLTSIADGITHYGNSYYKASLSSDYFSSGFAGAGWSIQHNRTTGNYAATFDELTVRKKMRIYELEVQKTSVTNGSLWVSNSCQGDMVTKL